MSRPASRHSQESRAAAAGEEVREKERGRCFLGQHFRGMYPR